LVNFINEKLRSIASISSASLPETNTPEQRFLAAYPVIIGSRLFKYAATPIIIVPKTDNATKKILFFVIIGCIIINQSV
jgi:hypothetical protein